MTDGSTADIRHILVVCEGNHCRAPMAEGLLKSLLPPPFQVASAGLNALVGLPADPEAQRLMAGAGLDISGHLGRQLTCEMATEADLILVMDELQKGWCGLMCPSALGRIFLLGHWRPAGSREIQDPFRRGPEIFRAVFEHIRQSVSDWPPRLAPQQRSA